MKKLNITYDTAEIENGEKIVGETCYSVKMQDALAEQLLRDPGSCGAIDMAHLELLLQSVELLQGRKVAGGSIKHYENKRIQPHLCGSPARQYPEQRVVQLRRILLDAVHRAPAVEDAGAAPGTGLQDRAEGRWRVVRIGQRHSD